VAKILYQKNANVYLAARSKEKTFQAIKDIKIAVPENKLGRLSYLHLDLADLTTIKTTVRDFDSKEDKLHILFNNAGVAYPGQGTKTKQGHELQMGVNCVGPFLFTKLLAPTLVSTAKSSSPNSVRVVWVSSSAMQGLSAKDFMDNLDYYVDKPAYFKYFASKLGNYFHATEFADRYKKDGVLSIAINPGNLESDLLRTAGPLLIWILRRTVLYPTVYGAYTEIYAAFSPSITMEESGCFSKIPC
jgi:retinol dehydrogenase 12